MSNEKRCGTCLGHKWASDNQRRCHTQGPNFGAATLDYESCSLWEPKPQQANVPNPYARTARVWATVDGVRRLVEAEVDPYRIGAAYRDTMEFEVWHALKKLCGSGTGEKPRAQELREAIASIERAIEMEGE